jgi:23S rRNA (adenine2503-C2)-methyltransferase
VSEHKKDIRLLSIEEIQLFLKDIGEPAFRAKQLYEWLWKKYVLSFDQMHNIPAKTLKNLEENFQIKTIKIQNTQNSSDKTIKTVFCLTDKHLIEGVLIPAEKRSTACISTQVGCTLSCKFCATGKMGWRRNLDHTEIFDQVMLINKQSLENYGIPLTNIVLMGMGEPLVNYNNVIKAISIITSPEVFNFSPGRITLSTAGIAKMIMRLGDDKVKFNLALSLHSANDEKRSQLMPVNEQNSLKKLSEALKYFHKKTRTRITIEYLLLDNFNDSPEDARELADFCRNFPCKINIIEYNPIDSDIYKNSSKAKEKIFTDFLKSRNMIVNIRQSKGKDIAAACGQLAGKGNK